MTLPVTVVDRNTTTSTDDGVCVLTTAADTFTVDVSKEDIFAMSFVFAATATITWGVSIDGVTFFLVSPTTALGGSNTGGSTGTSSQLYTIQCSAYNYVKITLSATTGNATFNFKKTRNANQNAGVNVANIFPGSSATALGKAEDGAHASGDVGLFALGVRNDTGLTFTSTDGDYSPLKLNGVGAAAVALELPTLVASLGLTVHHVVSAATTNQVSLKGASGSVGHIVVLNTAAAIKFFKFFNKASAPVTGTDTPVYTIGIPPGQTLMFDYTVGLPFSTGIAYAITNLSPDLDNTAVVAGDVIATIVYR